MLLIFYKETNNVILLCLSSIHHGSQDTSTTNPAQTVARQTGKEEHQTIQSCSKESGHGYSVVGHRKIMVSVMVVMSLRWGDEAFGGLYTDVFFLYLSFLLMGYSPKHLKQVWYHDNEYLEIFQI